MIIEGDRNSRIQLQIESSVESKPDFTYSGANNNSPLSTHVGSSINIGGKNNILLDDT